MWLSEYLKGSPLDLFLTGSREVIKQYMRLLHARVYMYTTGCRLSSGMEPFICVKVIKGEGMCLTMLLNIVTVLILLT